MLPNIRTAAIAAASLLLWGAPIAPALAQDAAEEAQLDQERASASSPDGRIMFETWSESGQPLYRVLFDGEEVVHPSRLGFRFAEGENLEGGLALASIDVSSADDTWELPWGERREVRDHHNEVFAVFHDNENTDRGFAVRARVFNDGLGFRYEVPAGDTASQRAIVNELTTFALPAEADAWWTWAGGYNRYEEIYKTTTVADVSRAHTPFTARTQDGVHIAIHEAALVDYAGMWLTQQRPGVLHADLAPAYDGVKVRTEGAFTTPWRTIQIADEAVGLINSDLILNLNEPNALGDVSWVKPGKYIGIWWGMHLGTMTWGSGPLHGATTERTREYIDFAAEHGFDGILVEGWNVGWDGDWFSNGDVFSFTEPYPDFDLEALTDYAAEKGVYLIGHHETSGGVTNYENQLEDALDLYARLGVPAIKTGYVADGGELMWRDEDGVARYEWHDGQFAVNHHMRVVQEAAERQISINPHEPIKDTGLRRTYPNWVTREGARGQEYNAWGEPVNPLDHIPVMTFTRMLSGPMDFTPGIFDLEFDRPEPDGRSMQIKSTLARQLALYVLIYSPIQMAADLPENYLEKPDAFQFIKDVPADWEHSMALQGEVGDFIVTARQERGGDDWYLGAATDEEARTVSVPLSFLNADQDYEAQIYRDGDDAHWETNPYAFARETRMVTARDTLEISLAPGGGAAVRFVAQSSAD